VRKKTKKGIVPKTDEVSTDSNGAAGHQGDGEDLIVGLRRLAGDQAGALQVLNTDAVCQANNVCDHEPDLAILGNLLGLHRGLEALAQSLVIFWGQIEVLEALLRILRHVPRNLEAADHLLSDANARARVGRNVDSRDSKTSGKCRGLEEELRKETKKVRQAHIRK